MDSKQTSKHLTLLSALLILTTFTQSLPAQEVPPISMKPVLQSLILPGTGEASLDYQKRSRFFLISEGTILIAALGSYTATGVLEDQYQAYAARQAGVEAQNKSHQYWVDVGNYSDLDAFNAEHLRFREIDALYPRTEDWDWSWDSDDKRHRFESMRIAADRWQLAGKFLLGGLVVNHIVSAVDVIYLQNRERQTELSFLPWVQPTQNSFGYALTFTF